ncbi:uncharacterized protein CLUP02_02255 [Colletotrichum lupini]|uniref:Uncharacterized protein n=1 Tax=Colletotrichum lupini TaxID=145971 RepID=A0A9Q8SE57_9PEZI|nr:uncharacterized protein CLUP02_02255 [Colletotrichum lupini]UQC75599.1 hypothetical protein CLUP02_02255 [Colletotrichum lupini]
MEETRRTPHDTCHTQQFPVSPQSRVHACIFHQSTVFQSISTSSERDMQIHTEYKVLTKKHLPWQDLRTSKECIPYHSAYLRCPYQGKFRVPTPTSRYLFQYPNFGHASLRNQPTTTRLNTLDRHFLAYLPTLAVYNDLGSIDLPRLPASHAQHACRPHSSASYRDTKSLHNKRDKEYKHRNLPLRQHRHGQFAAPGLPGKHFNPRKPGAVALTLTQSTPSPRVSSVSFSSTTQRLQRAPIVDLDPPPLSPLTPHLSRRSVSPKVKALRHTRHDGSILCLSHPSIDDPAPRTWDPIRVAHCPGSLSSIAIHGRLAPMISPDEAEWSLKHPPQTMSLPVWFLRVSLHIPTPKILKKESKVTQDPGAYLGRIHHFAIQCAERLAAAMPPRKAKLNRQRKRRYELFVRAPARATRILIDNTLAQHASALLAREPGSTALTSSGRHAGPRSTRLVLAPFFKMPLDQFETERDRQKDSGPEDASSAPLLPKFRTKDDGRQFLGNNLGFVNPYFSPWLSSRCLQHTNRSTSATCSHTREADTLSPISNWQMGRAKSSGLISISPLESNSSGFSATFLGSAADASSHKIAHALSRAVTRHSPCIKCAGPWRSTLRIPVQHPCRSRDARWGMELNLTHRPVRCAATANVPGAAPTRQFALQDPTGHSDLAESFLQEYGDTTLAFKDVASSQQPKNIAGHHQRYRLADPEHDPTTIAPLSLSNGGYEQGDGGLHKTGFFEVAPRRLRKLGNQALYGYNYSGHITTLDGQRDDLRITPFAPLQPMARDRGCVAFRGMHHDFIRLRHAGRVAWALTSLPIFLSKQKPSYRNAWFLNTNNKLGCSGISKLHCAAHRRRRLIVVGSRASACSMSRSRFTIVVQAQPLPPAAQRIWSLNQIIIYHSVVSPIYEVPQLSAIISPNRTVCCSLCACGRYWKYRPEIKTEGDTTGYIVYSITCTNDYASVEPPDGAASHQCLFLMLRAWKSLDVTTLTVDLLAIAILIPRDQRDTRKKATYSAYARREANITQMGPSRGPRPWFTRGAVVNQVSPSMYSVPCVVQSPAYAALDFHDRVSAGFFTAKSYEVLRLQAT